MSKRHPPKPVPPTPSLTHDLVVLAADKDSLESLLGLLGTRTRALGIRPVSLTSLTHPNRDPGCLRQSAELLRPYLKTHRFALIVFDREGCGENERTREQIETGVEDSLQSHWPGRVAAVVNDPELENWVWSRSPHLPGLLGWDSERQKAGLYEWLVDKGHLDTLQQPKPRRPKEAMEAVLYHVHKPRSSAIFRAIAEKVRFDNCSDPAFLKLCSTLRGWFPAP